ncbi:sulfonate ABC transporter substrate-binding protein [Dendronalium sp. ChiSLP03b]|uniref:sulfonate ABC transporter substrate-binding protein n=1 Tax=Dendronalium sp. ChiSLP03b TaxID=3075381 RepID=UPI002AD9450F|nr:sulfonate ABC transporter substrate-binding protein [Dendronalium sp. ChiSLP03b]
MLMSYSARRNVSLFLTLSLGSLLITLVGCNPQPQTSQKASTTSDKKPTTVRIVYSKLGPLAVVRKQGTLEKRLKAEGNSITWHEFAAGPQSLEALNANSLDITSTAESPVIFAQAAGTPLVYISTTQPSPKGVAFVVPKNSSIKSVADLKGKKIALQKASVAQYIIVQALKEVGLKLSDVTPVYLPPPDANVAFSQAKVDAWIAWEPYITRVEEQGIGRILRDGTGLRDIGGFYSTTRQFAKEHPEIIKAFLEEMQKAEQWSKNNPRELAQLLSKEVGIDVNTLEKVHARLDYGLLPITNQIVTKQQKIADMYYDLKLLPKKVDIKEVILSPEEYAKITPQQLTSKQ